MVPVFSDTRGSEDWCPTNYHGDQRLVDGSWGEIDSWYILLAFLLALYLILCLVGLSQEIQSRDRLNQSLNHGDVADLLRLLRSGHKGQNCKIGTERERLLSKALMRREEEKGDLLTLADSSITIGMTEAKPVVDRDYVGVD